MPLSSSRTPAMRIKDATYPAEAEHIGQVRADLQGLLGDYPAADDVILCASELATNAVVHSDSRKPGGRFTARAEVIPRRYARIEVEDSGGPWLTSVSDPDYSRGHGLDIVSALAADWGIDGDHRARTVWARFDWP
jgi:anti-sigma regulatory factor (Ser/Thr protein kinase)